MDDQESHRVQATFGPAEMGALARPPSQSDCVLLPGRWEDRLFGLRLGLRHLILLRAEHGVG
jgi:hypothetical protein